MGCGSAPDESMTNSGASSGEDSGPAYLAYFGSYTRGDSEGIQVYRFDAGSGKMTPLGLAAKITNPSFVAIHPNHRYLYAVTEAGQGKGAVSAFEIDKESGKLKPLNQVSSQGAGPCHLNVDATGKMLAVANYGGGSTSSFPINEDGSLGEAASVMKHEGSSIDEKRQKKPYGHSVNFSPDNRFLITADLGADKLFIHKINPETATLEPNDPPSVSVKAGGGPRHFTFHPSGRYAYVINEMGNTITAFNYDAQRGALEEMQMISTLPAGYAQVTHTAEIRVHPSGKFIYGSNRGHDSIAVFAVDESTGKLTLIEIVPTGGETPRNFNIDPTGKYLLAENQSSDSVVVFKIDQITGQLTPTGDVIATPAPVCLRFVPLS